MTIQRGRIFLAGLVITVVTLGASLAGFAPDQFLEGAAGGGVLTVLAIAANNRSH